MSEQPNLGPRNAGDASLHFTYRAIKDANCDLEQGDILEPTEGLRNVFRQVHKHFEHAKYVAFMVITQSCDLVRRKSGDPCKAKHVELCVVRELQPLCSEILHDAAGTKIPRLLRVSRRDKAIELLKSIHHQNEQSIGLFYLHPAAAMSFATPSVAQLRISIALKREHYDALVQSRRGRLDEAFQAKLGWLIGNLYSRVGTLDWKDSNVGEGVLDRQVAELVKNTSDVVWASDKVIRQVENDPNAGSFESLSIDELRTKVKEVEPKPAKEQLISSVMKILDGKQLLKDDQTRKQIETALKNDQTITNVCNRL